MVGIPTPISYDLVTCGKSYGVVFEMLGDAETVRQTAKNFPAYAKTAKTSLPSNCESLIPPRNSLPISLALSFSEL